MNKPTSDSEIKQFFGGMMNILTYSQLQNFTLQQLINSMPCFILIRSQPNSGHWVSLMKNKDGIFYFDSYGIDKDTRKDIHPDDELLWFNNNLNGNPVLMNLLSQAHNQGIPIYTNTYPYQKYSPSISTCGKHAMLRNVLCNETEKQYLNTLNKMKKVYNCKDYDELVYKFFKQFGI